MNSEIRNELLQLMYLGQNRNDKEYLERGINYIIDRIEVDLQNKMKDAQRTISECEEDLKLLDAVRKNIKEK